MIRLARDSMALASVASFVWMVCTVGAAGGADDSLHRQRGGAADGGGRRPGLSSTCGCARPIRCWKARSRPTRSATLAARPTACRPWRSTDRANLFGALEFSVTAKDAGVQPIIGCALPVTGIGEGPPERWAAHADRRAAGPERDRLSQPHATVVAAYLDIDGDRRARACRGPRSAQHAEGLILLSGGPDGPVDPLFAAGKAEEARAALAEMHAAFGDRFYVELQRHGLPSRGRRRAGPGGLRLRQRRAAGRHQRRLFRQAPTCTRRTTRCCASPTAPSWARTSAAGSPREHWFKPAAAMRDAVRRPAGGLRQHPRYRPALRLHGREARPDPAALPDRRRPHRGRGTGPPGARGPAGAPGRPTSWPRPRQDYWDRLEREIGVISTMGFSGYFLIVSDFIKWAKAHGIPVGPGPGLGRRLAGRLGADHHRPRSAALRPAVRALPQPRAGLDARLRHRLLPGAARGGDRLRPGASTAATGWPRSSPSAPCRRAPCCATSAG